MNRVNQLLLSISSSDTRISWFVRFGALPTVLTYYQKSRAQVETHVVCLLTDGKISNGTWYVGIFNEFGIDANYSLSYSASTSCPNNCTDEQHGKCVEGICECFGDFVLHDCSAIRLPIYSDHSMSGSIAAEQWNFYTIRVRGYSALKITLEEIDTVYVGNVWLYALKGDFPSTQNYLFKEISDSENHTVSLQPTFLFFFS